MKHSVSQISYVLWYIICTKLCIVVSIDSEKCVVSDYCKCTTEVSGIVINLKQYEKKFPVSANDSQEKGYTYKFNPCSKLTDAGCQDSAVCQFRKSDLSSPTPAGFFDKVEYIYLPSIRTLNITYNGTEKRHSRVQVYCGANAEFEFLAPGETGSGTMDYDLILNIRGICEEKPKGLSIGSVLVIIFFILLIVYIIGGILILRFVRGARGVEQIPNVEFWKDFPFLVKDGTVFVIRGCKADTRYQEI